MKYGIAGYGRLGKATERMLPAIANKIWDPPLSLDGDLSECDMIFVCTPTPCDTDGHVLIGIDEIANQAKEGSWLCIRSTVSPGDTDALAALWPRLNWCVAPEFRSDKELEEDTTPKGFPILGWATVWPVPDVLEEIFYGDIYSAPTTMSRSEAELVKIIANCALATQVALANEFHELAEKVGADWEPIRKGLLEDNRVGSHWRVTEERGFGGRCLPKDLDATIECLEQMGVEHYGLRAVRKANEARFQVAVNV